MVDATLIQMSRQEYAKYGSEAMIKVSLQHPSW